MFVQYDFSHILFNMLWLYWFAKLFLHFFNPKQMFALYIYGGLGGALLYMAAYNLFPYFSDSVHNSLMIGASASILAIVVATAVYEPKYPVNLIIFGSIPLMWIAGGTIIIDFISIIESNAGGHIAHLGGAIVGFLFASSYKKGVDITIPFNNILDRLATPRQHNSQRERKPRFETSGTRRNTQPNASRQQDNQSETELNVILDKIRRSGYSSLTDAERHKLFSITTPKDDK